MDRLGVGIIGSKFAAGFHADCYRRNEKVELVAVAAIDALEEFARAWDIPHTYEDYRRMLARDDIDLVSLCLPNHLHCEAAVAAAQAGKHVVCEKPLATTLADAERIVSACAEAGVKLFYAEDWVFAPALSRAEQIIAEGGIGDLLYIKAREVHNGSHSPFAKTRRTCGGGCLIHLAVHPIGYVLYLLGREGNRPVTVTACTNAGGADNFVHKDFEGEDWSVGVMEFADGQRALIEGNYITVGGMDDLVEMYGTEGRMNIHLTFGSCMEVYSRKGYGYAIEKADFTHGWTRPAVDEFFNLGYVHELRYFVDCVLGDVQPKYGVNGQAGVDTLRVVQAMYRSAESGRTVRLEW